MAFHVDFHAKQGAKSTSIKQAFISQVCIHQLNCFKMLMQCLPVSPGVLVRDSGIAELPVGAGGEVDVSLEVAVSSQQTEG